MLNCFGQKRGQKGMEIYLLRQYVAGPTGRNRADLENLKKICMENLEGKWRIEIVDLREKKR